MENTSTHWELPIQTANVDCVTDCWVYNRLAIIATSPYYEDWMASHYELYTAGEYNFYFGETSLMPPGYHDAILERRQLRLFAMTEATILAAFRKELLQGWYVIFYMKDFNVQDHYHEVLIYGFDDETEAILVAGLKGHTFQNFTIPYAYIRDTLADLKQYFMDDIQQGANLSFHFQYPVTALRPRADYETANCPFEAYVKLENELKGDAFTRQTMFGFDDYRENETIYRGINCLYGFMKMLQQEMEGRPFGIWFRGIAGGAKKIHEHQRMLRRTMGYLIEKWEDAINDQGRSCYRDFCSYSATTEKWLHMVLKYQQTGEKEILKRVVAEVPDIFCREQADLRRFLYSGIDWERFNRAYI